MCDDDKLEVSVVLPLVNDAVDRLALAHEGFEVGPTRPG